MFVSATAAVAAASQFRRRTTKGTGGTSLNRQFCRHDPPPMIEVTNFIALDQVSTPAEKDATANERQARDNSFSAVIAQQSARREYQYDDEKVRLS